MAARDIFMPASISVFYQVCIILLVIHLGKFTVYLNLFFSFSFQFT